jgi:hypothetical protein
VVVDWEPVIRAVLAELANNVAAATLSATTKPWTLMEVCGNCSEVYSSL